MSLNDCLLPTKDRDYPSSARKLWYRFISLIFLSNEVQYWITESLPSHLKSLGNFANTPFSLLLMLARVKIMIISTLIISINFAGVVNIDPCVNITCSHPLQKCTTDDKGKPVCSCTHLGSCPKIIKPVCGDDGQNYDNKCILDFVSCEKGKVVSVDYEGKCEPDITSSKLDMVLLLLIV